MVPTEFRKTFLEFLFIYHFCQNEPTNFLDLVFVKNEEIKRVLLDSNYDNSLQVVPEIVKWVCHPVKVV